MGAAGSLMSGPVVCDVRCPPINLAMVSKTTSATMPLAATHHPVPLRALDRACATALRPSRLDFAAALEPFLVAISTLPPRALPVRCGGSTPNDLRSTYIDSRSHPCVSPTETDTRIAPQEMRYRVICSRA